MLFITLVNYAQLPLNSIVEDMIVDMSVNNEREIDWENLLQDWSELKQQPLDLNTISRNQLEEFPFLTDKQIENILAYVYLNGPMQTVYELQLIEGMDWKTIHCLMPFVCVNKVESTKKLYWKDVFRYGRHEALAQMDIPCYRRSGYNTVFLGPSMGHSLRYSFRYQNRIYAGLVGQNDQGEPWFGLYNKQGYDYYSYYLLIKDMGRLKTLALGNYRLSFGLGLVVNHQFMLGKSSNLSTVRFRGQHIRKHSSTDEYNYFRGIAATLELTPHLEFSPFYSHRCLDGRIENDSLLSISKTGLHRTKSESQRKNTIALQTTGANLTYYGKRWKVGMTGIYYFFNHPLEPKYRQYAQFNIHGRQFFNVGLDYQFRWNKVSWQGEIAKGKKGFALLNQCNYYPLDDLQLMLIHRYYSHDYWALFSNSFGEGSGTQNENGWYVGGNWKPLRYWNFFASLDFFSFPWWKYRISKPSQGVDVLAKVSYEPLKPWMMEFYYRFKHKERDVPGPDDDRILPINQHTMRIRFKGKWHENLSARTYLDYSCTMIPQIKISHGIGLTQQVSYIVPIFPLQTSAQITYFKTGDYDSRIYIPEKGMLYSFYVPSYYGHGFRWTVHLRYDVNEHWMGLVKLGQTVYGDRTSISTGSNTILANRKMDVQLQVRCKF